VLLQAGGGGGGGRFGSGAGGGAGNSNLSGAGGGGGSGYADPSATNVVFATGVQSGDGRVVINWTAPTAAIVAPPRLTG
jgi:hypothetical protein